MVFILAGLGFASLVSRAPSIQHGLDLRPSGYGLLLLSLSVGSVTALPLSGPLVQRHRPARVVGTAALAMGTGLVVVGAGVASGLVVLTAVGLFLTGCGAGSWDVAMNVEATYVERETRRTLMPRFHAGFSLGTVAGALLGAAAAALGVHVTVQLIITAALLVVLTPLGVRRFLPDVSPGAGVRPRRAFRAWREPRTLAVGLVVLAFAFTEGSANDWLAISFVNGHHTSAAIGAVGLGVFLTAMTLGRMFGGQLVDRFGRVMVLLVSAVCAAGGLLLVALGAAIAMAVVGALLWGLGTSLGFPSGMSAAGDDPDQAAARVSVVSSIGYTAFLAGPPLIGFLADEYGILHALLVVLVALLLSLIVSPATRPSPPADHPGPPTNRTGQTR